MIELSAIPAPDSFIYLASPYSGLEFEQHLRYVYTKLAMKYLAEERLAAYSPIVSWHAVAYSYKLDKSAEYWDLLNGGFVQQCSELWVLMLPGWEESLGIKLERDYAEALGKPVRFAYFPPELNRLLIMDGVGIDG